MTASVLGCVTTRCANYPYCERRVRGQICADGVTIEDAATSELFANALLWSRAALRCQYCHGGCGECPGCALELGVCYAEQIHVFTALASPIE